MLSHQCASPPGSHLVPEGLVKAKATRASDRWSSRGVGTLDAICPMAYNVAWAATYTLNPAAPSLPHYTVERIVSPVAYKLKLPASLRIHPVFHVSLLQPWHSDTEFPEHVEQQYQPPPIVAEDNQYTLEALLDKRICRGRTEYLVRWEGYGPEWDLWTKEGDIEDSLIRAYEATHHAALPTARRSTRKSPRQRGRQTR